jgi:hypothetical protein
MTVRGLLLVLGTGALLSCGAWRPAPTGSGGDCSQTQPTNGPPYTRASGPPGSGGGSAAVTPGQAPQPGPPSPAPPLPAPAPDGRRVVVTAVNTRQTIAVPAGTLVEVRLEPTDGVQWTVPESSDPHALPRLLASGPCDAVKAATFRADGSGQITAEQPHGDAVAEFVVTVQATASQRASHPASGDGISPLPRDHLWHESVRRSHGRA